MTLQNCNSRLLQYAPKTWVELYFKAPVCAELDHEQLAALGSRITDKTLRGTVGISNACLVAIDDDTWEKITDDAALDRIVGDLPPGSFNNIGTKRLHSNVLGRLSADQLAAFDISTAVATRCSTLDLSALNPLSTAKLDLGCFMNALNSVTSVDFKVGFFTNAPANILSQLKPKDLDKFDKASPAWPSLQPPHVTHIWELVKDDITANIELVKVLAPNWAKYHSVADFDLITSMEMEEVQKLPWQMLNGEHVLSKLGSKKIKALKSDILKQDGAIALFNHAPFRAAMTPSQFTLLFCRNDSSCDKCSTYNTSLLADVSRATLKTLPSACLSKMRLEYF